MPLMPLSRLCPLHLLCSPLYPSALALQQINMASSCKLQGAGDVVSGKVFAFSMKAQALVPNTTIKTKQHNETSELGTEEMAQ